MTTSAPSNIFLLKRSIDLSLLRQGFHIPPEFHALVYAALGRKLHHGEGCEGLCFEFANDVREAVYDFSYQTAVLETENKSPRGERATAEAIANGFLTEEDLQKRSEKGSDLTIFEGKPSQKPSNLTENNQKQPNLSTFDEKQPQKQPNLSISDFPTMVTWNVYQAIKLNRKAKYSWLQDNLGVSESTILRAINDLKKLRYIDPEHSKVKGEWQLLK